MNRIQAEKLVQDFILAAYDSGYYSGREMSSSYQCQKAIKERKRLREKLITALCQDTIVEQNVGKEQ